MKNSQLGMKPDKTTTDAFKGPRNLELKDTESEDELESEAAAEADDAMAAGEGADSEHVEVLENAETPTDSDGGMSAFVDELTPEEFTALMSACEARSGRDNTDKAKAPGEREKEGQSRAKLGKGDMLDMAEFED